jgi:uncharacterized protein (DUF952 family)
VTSQPPPAQVILHITTPQLWNEAQAAGAHAADSLATEGFIHCSTPEQVTWVAEQRFSGRTEMIVLHIDPALVPSEIRYENLEGGTRLFPHVYGPIPCAAVISVTRLFE